MVMNCEKVWSEISNYIDGDVDTVLRTAIEEHFRTCNRCVSVLNGARNVVELYGDDRMIEVPRGFGRRLERRLSQERRGPKSSWSAWSWWLIPVAALALIVGGLRWANLGTRENPLRVEVAHARYDIPPELPVVISVSSKEFHVPGCDLIGDKEKVETMTARKAIREGYIPCAKCMRRYLQAASLSGDSQRWHAEARSPATDEPAARRQQDPGM